MLLKKPTLDFLDPSNYHPVLNFSFLGKAIKRMIAEQLQRFLDDKSSLGPFQSNFRLGHEMEMALVVLLNEHRRNLIAATIRPYSNI